MAIEAYQGSVRVRVRIWDRVRVRESGRVGLGLGGMGERVFRSLSMRRTAENR